MKRFVLMFLVLCLLSNSSVWAKRSPPAKVAPVRDGAVEYRIEHGQMGCVEAWDVGSKQLLWRRQVYVVRYDVDLERDVQDVFLTAVEVQPGKLHLKNERGSEYQLDLESLQVTAVKGKLVESKLR